MPPQFGERSAPAVRIATPSKLNLFLELKSRRADRFHELETVMVTTSICDVVEFRPTNDPKISIECKSLMARHASAVSNGNVRGTDLHSATGNNDGIEQSLPNDEDNLAVRAAALIRDYCQVDRGAHISLGKRIPLGSGQGGGSSDAAATLLAANQAWGLNLPRSRLAPLAAELGSDVAFFLDGGCQLATGRGELLEPLVCALGPWCVVASPPASLSTADVYKMSRVSSDQRSSSQMIDGLQKGDLVQIGKCMFNRLERAAESLCPWIGKMRKAFSETTALGHQLTGSGSTYFGLFTNRTVARRMAGILQAKLPLVSIAVTRIRNWNFQVC